MKAADAGFARTLARGIDLLLCFKAGEVELSHSELARRLELGGPTVVRLTYTLERLGYLRRDASTGRYRLGAAAVALAYPLLADMRVRAIARPLMFALSEQMGGAVSLGFRHQATMVYVESAWRGDDRVLPPDVGAPMPMLNTAMGRAWLCRATAAERERVINRIRLSEPEAHARFAPSIDHALSEFRLDGFCSSRGEFRSEINAFAVPFSKPVDSTLFVMNCGVLEARRPFAEARKMAGPRLQELVRKVEVAVGIRDDEPTG